MLNISGLNEGIVIDHIKAGDGMKIYSYLNLEESSCCVALIKNAKSNKMEKKDIIKIEGPFDVDFNILGALDPNITVNIIENGKISKKINPELPNLVKGIISCKNPRCVTSVEPNLIHTFKLANKENAIYRCIYCDQQFKK